MSTVDTNRSSAEDRVWMKKIDATGWGVFFIWVGVALVADVGWGIALLGTGVISLGVQVARRLVDLPVDRWSVGFGSCLTVAGLLQWLGLSLGGIPVPTWVFPAAIAALGIAVLVSTWLRGHGPA